MPSPAPCSPSKVQKNLTLLVFCLLQVALFVWLGKQRFAGHGKKRCGCVVAFVNNC